MKEEPVKAISEDEEEEEEEPPKKKKKKLVDKISEVLPVVKPNSPVVIPTGVKNKVTYVGFGAEDDAALINTIVKADSEGISIDSVWATLASMVSLPQLSHCQRILTFCLSNSIQLILNKNGRRGGQQIF